MVPSGQNVGLHMDIFPSSSNPLTFGVSGPEVDKDGEENPQPPSKRQKANHLARQQQTWDPGPAGEDSWGLGDECTTTGPRVAPHPRGPNTQLNTVIPASPLQDDPENPAPTQNDPDPQLQRQKPQQTV